MENGSEREALAAKAQIFRDLHAGETFIMPNAWDAGSAKLLAAAGFPAIATTSAGVNYTAGRTDYDYRVCRASMMEAYQAIAAAVPLPVSGDLENGFGHSADAVADTIRHSVRCGMVGGGIEDHTGDPEMPLYDLELAVDRIRAAREAADASGVAYTVTARAECFWVGHPDPFEESVLRLNRYREAGADCLYAPGIKDAETIGALVREVDGPVNVVMGLVGANLSVAALADLGVTRISIGGSLARAALAVVRDAAREMAERGTFGFAEQAIPDAEINAFFGASGESI